MAGHRRKNLIASRRRVEDEGEDGGHDAGDLDDSQSEGSVISDDDDVGDDSDVDTASAPSPELKKSAVNGHSVPTTQQAKIVKSAVATHHSPTNGATDTDIMLNRLKISEGQDTSEETNFEEMRENTSSSGQPLSVAKSSAQMDQPQETPLERRRREHEDYKKKRDADPAFVPNRGAFFLHDHRHSGPAANGFRPFGRGRGRGRGGIGGAFATASYSQQDAETADAPWTHDMHEVVAADNRAIRGSTSNPQGDLNASTRSVPQAPRGTPPNRSLSTIRDVGKVQLRVFLSHMKEPIIFPGVAIKQYTHLPDHRPPLRRDKPVRISLPNHAPRYIFPAMERSFIFIPRAMRPNQQGFGSRSNRVRPGIVPIGAFSRQTSIYGGSIYGSVYTPSIAMSRRSSLAFEVPRDSLISPAGSTMSRPPIPMDTTRPVVRLPPPVQQDKPQGVPPLPNGERVAVTTSTDDLPRHQTYTLPQKPTFRENRTNPIPMHQPRPQKAVYVADIESPATLSFNPPQQLQQPFHQQVPAQVNGDGYTHESHLNPHSRNASYPSQASTGTPLSQIPERAIHAQPFQPALYPQQGFYPTQYQIMPPQQGYYYPPQYSSSIAPTAASYIAAPPQGSYGHTSQSDPATSQQGVASNLVTQEVNGMVYYYDASQLPAVATFPTYPAPQGYPIQPATGVAMQHGMMTPSPDGFYYPQPAQGVVYYPQ